MEEYRNAFKKNCTYTHTHLSTWYMDKLETAQRSIDEGYWQLCVNSLKPSGATWHHGNLVNIGLGSGLLPVQWQAITWTNADLLSIKSSGTKNDWYSNQDTNINEEIVFKNVVCKVFQTYNYQDIWSVYSHGHSVNIAWVLQFGKSSTTHR